MKIGASLVIYKESPQILSQTIANFLDIKVDKELVVMDNWNNQELLSSFSSRFSYYHLPKNIGFGAAHNLAFTFLSKDIDVYLILNPDISFSPSQLKNFLEWFVKEKEIVLAIPSVLNLDGTFQGVIREIPTLSSLLKRKLKISTGEMVISEGKIEEIPSAHGCFFAFKPEVFRKLNGFDERFFLYLEDIDIWMRAKKYGKTVINSNFHIYHYWQRASSKDLKAFFWHLQSWAKFFKKYPYLLLR